MPSFFTSLYTYSWFVGLLVAGLVHIVLTALFPIAQTMKAAEPLPEEAAAAKKGVAP